MKSCDSFILKEHSYFNLASILKKDLDEIRERNFDTHRNYWNSEIEFLIRYLDIFAETVAEFETSKIK